jgi:hypothetical protein
LFGGRDIHCVRDVGFRLERHSSVDQHRQQPINGVHDQLVRFRAGILGRAVLFDRNVLSFGDLDREHLVLRLDVRKSGTVFAMAIRGVIPPRPKKRREAKCQSTPPRTKRASKKENILPGTLAFVVKGDKGRADKRGEHVLHALAKFLDVLVREDVLLRRRAVLLPIAATIGIRHIQGLLNMLRELLLQMAGERGFPFKVRRTFPRRDG